MLNNIYINLFTLLYVDIYSNIHCIFVPLTVDVGVFDFKFTVAIHELHASR